jgi:biopolymer transport protein ExbD
MLILASVAALLICLNSRFGSHASAGLLLPEPGVRAFRLEECYDDRSVIVFVEKSGTTRINETQEPVEKLEGTLSLIFQNRQVETEVVFVYPDPEVSYEEFLNVYQKVARGAKGVKVGLLTRGTRDALDACSKQHDPPCGLEWADSVPRPECMAYPLFPVPVPKQ